MSHCAPAYRLSLLTLATSALVGLSAWGWLKVIPASDRHAAPQRPVAVSENPAQSVAIPALAERAQPMYLLLTVEGLDYCPENDTSDALKADLVRQNFDNAAHLQHLLESIEPGGAQGKIQAGYVITTKLLSLFKPDSDGQGWTFDAGGFACQLRLVEKLDRPVALYLSSTHFDTQGPLPQKLSQEAANLALFPDLKPATLSYFSYPIVPYTLQTDGAIAVNHYKRQALAHIHQMVQALAPEHRRKIVAIFLGGETHQFYQGFEDGMGEFAQPVVTDYSPASQQQFRAWLAQRYGSIDALNQAWGSALPSFDAIAAPAGNFRAQPQTPLLAHYDGYAQGSVPVHGWFWDASGTTEALRVYLDGQYIGPAQWGLNRLDVYRAVEDIATPAVGFRMNLPFDRLPAGRHMVSITHAQGAYECLMDERVIEVLRPAPAAGADAPLDFSDKHRVFTSMRDKPLRCPQRAKAGKRYYLDSPAWDMKVAFNPAARDWNLFRQAQVRAYMQQLYDWAVEMGYDASLLFSHQIVPELNSSWNENLFATQGSVAADTPWKPGFNLYGAGAWSPWTQDFLQRLAPQEGGYGIPEFHPQQWKDARSARAAIAHHYNAGAHFLSPYYFSIIPPQYLQDPTSNAVARMRLEAGNSADGSNVFYEAIREYARQ